jgi:two-component system chemotaxis response regulator CheY
VKPFTAKALYQKIEHVIEKPRLFVLNDQYFGPDRRRKKDINYNGSERRSNLKHQEIEVSADDINKAKILQQEARYRIDQES